MCFIKRKTIEIEICASTFLLPNPFCLMRTRRRFYVDPKQGEPVRPTSICQVCEAPEETFPIDVCAESGIIPTENCASIETRFFRESEIPTAICQIHIPMILVEVCAETGLLPNEWCYTWARLFKPDEVPKEICRVHADPDPIIDTEACAKIGPVKAPGEWCLEKMVVPIHQSALPLTPCDKHTRPRIPVFVGIYDRLVALGDKRLALRREKQA